MDILAYAFFSLIIIMMWHFTLSTHPKDFGLMQMVGIFILGGVFGMYMNSMEVAILMSVVLSLIFI